MNEYIKNFEKLRKIKSRIESLIDLEGLSEEDTLSVLMYIICDNNKLDDNKLESSIISSIIRFNYIKSIVDGST